MTPIELPQSPQRILLIKPSALGDIVHALPVLNLLKRRWPDARISWLVASSFAGLLDGHPMLESVIRFDRHRFAKWWRNPRALWELIAFTRDLRRRHFDLIIDLQGLLRSALTGRLAHSPVRVGFANAREGAWMFYTHRVDAQKDQHALHRYLLVAEALGCGRTPVEFHFSTTDEDRGAVDALVPRDRPFAVLLPGTNWPTKRWPVEYFSALVGPLRKRYGLASVIAGGAGDAALAKRIDGGIDVTGRTSLKQLVALLERASVVIANDSGPMHIAAALGRPLVTMFGPTNPLRTGPWSRDETVQRVDIHCSPCYSRRCSHQSCMKWLIPERVLSAIDESLRLGSGSSDSSRSVVGSQVVDGSSHRAAGRASQATHRKTEPEN